MVLGALRPYAGTAGRSLHVTLTRTHTRTHTEISFANPYLVCDICRRPTVAWHDPEQCGPGCEVEALNLPCEHLAGVVSTCPSWSPVDGCQCQDPSEHLALPTRS